MYETPESPRYEVKHFSKAESHSSLDMISLWLQQSAKVADFELESISICFDWSCDIWHHPAVDLRGQW